MCKKMKTTPLKVGKSKINDDAIQFGFKLSRMREIAGFTKKELAKRAGLVTATIMNVERGKQAPSSETLRKLERAFGCTLYYGEHVEMKVRVENQEADIDEGIAPLITEIWLAGIETFMCCQQDAWGFVWIMFPDVANAAAFLNIVARYEKGKNNLYSRMYPRLINDGGIPDWEYDISVDDMALLDRWPDDEDVYYPPAIFSFRPSIRFWPQDLPVVLKRLRKYNLAQKGISPVSSNK